MLYGGKGPDSFFFDTKLNATTNVDKIMDFKPVDDILVLSRLIFKKLPAGGLAETAFRMGKKALDADDRIIYDKATGSLSYDPDGNGRAAKVKFAVLVNKVTITHDDFAIG